VNCVTDSFTVSGTVSGLAGTGLVLQNNNGDNTVPNTDGSFRFSAQLDQSNYAVTVMTPPTAPSQTCTVSNGSGTLAGADVSNVQVVCVTVVEEFSIGGSLAGLAASAAATLNLNGAEDLVVGNGEFAFSTLLTVDQIYTVSVASVTPDLYQCSVLRGSGTVAGTHVRDIDILCIPELELKGGALSQEALITWTDSGVAASYDLYLSTAPGCDFRAIGSCPGGTLVSNVSSPYLARGLTNGQAYYYRLVANFTGPHELVSNEIGLQPGPLSFDGTVTRITHDNAGNVYLLGSFNRIGSASGGGIPFSPIHSYPERFDYDPVAGSVTSVIADGAGGYFIAGTFNRVGAQLRRRVAHILPSGKVDPNWSVEVAGTVRAMALDPVKGVLYLGGSGVNSVNNIGRANLVALDAGSGALIDWTPFVSGNVNALALGPGDAVTGPVLYVGGDFSGINDIARNSLAAIATKPVSNYVLDWDPNADSVVLSLAVGGGRVFAGGTFLTINGQARKFLAALDSRTGVVDLNWDPAPNAAVEDLIINGATVYVAGWFSTIGGVRQNKLAQVSLVNGKATAWRPQITTRALRRMTMSSDAVYIADYDGTTLSVNGKSRNGVAAIAKTDGARTLDWNPGIVSQGIAAVLAGSGGTIYVGGEITSIGASPATRPEVASITPDGRLRSWTLATNGKVHSLAIVDSTVYVAGEFTAVNGFFRSNLAAVNRITGMATSWNPAADALTHYIEVADGMAYVAGNFTRIGGARRQFFAQLDTLV
ncbi:MAG: hypothetical protein OEY28_12455, partial [Nitrospira sp.]|nr:hypothetical protein [Nitrospira sp.]